MKREIPLDNKTILVTGSPGFIGANLVIRLLSEMKGGTVVSFDNMNDYYDVSLKEWRLEQIEKLEQLRLLESGIPIKVVEVDYRGRTHCAIDTPEDAKKAEEIILTEGELIN